VGKAPGYGFLLWLGLFLAGVVPYPLKKTPELLITLPGDSVPHPG